MAEDKTTQHAPPPPPPPPPATTNTSNATTTMSNATISSTPPDEDPLRDEEGLLLEYDVVVCGTGLVQAILASALARAGKRVLHCDGEDSYGELDAVWSLDQLECMKEKYSTAPSNTRPTTATTTTTTDIDILLNPKGATSTLQFHSYQTTTHFGITIGTPVQTPYGRGVVKSIPTTNELESSSSSSSSFSVAVALDQWTLADQSTPVSYFGMSKDAIAATTCLDTPLALEEYLGTTHQVYALASIEAQELVLNVQDSRQQRRRSWALDASPVFVLAAGRAVDGMLASNVAEYLEFQSVHGLMWLELPEDKKISKNKNKLSKVPCNKADVFGTKLLSPLDKRRLMKFLQLAMDYATQYSAAEAIRQDKEDNNDDDHDATVTSNNDNNNENDAAEVHTLNERYLNQGRSLARPQNKAVATDELKTLQNYLQQDDDSDEDATTTISKKRKMTLDDYLKKQHKLSDPLRRLVRYALAMETTVESVSLSQGMGQLRHHLQALGRYGSTAFLVPLYGSGELSQAFCRSAAVFGATYLLRRAALGIQLQTNEEGDKNDDSKFTTQVHGVVIANDTLDEEGQPHQSSSSSSKTIRCHHVVVPTAALRTQHFSSRSKRTYIVRRISLLKGRLMEGDQRHIIVIPPGSLSKDHSHAIHGITLDESVQVAPAGCTILHLTTTIVVDTEGDDSNTSISSSEDKERRIDTSILDRASHAILEASVASGLPPVDQVLATTYSHEQLSVPDEPLPTGIHVCSSISLSATSPIPPQVLTADAAFDQAEQLFRTICPRQAFLGLSEELDATIRERAVERDDYDDERLMLESALGMIDGGESAGPTGVTKTTNNEEEAASAQEEESMDPPQPSEVPP